MRSPELQADESSRVLIGDVGFDYRAVQCFGAIENHLASFGELLGHDHRNARLQDSGLFPGDFPQANGQENFRDRNRCG